MLPLAAGSIFGFLVLYLNKAAALPVVAEQQPKMFSALSKSESFRSTALFRHNPSRGHPRFGAGASWTGKWSLAIAQYEFLLKARSVKKGPTKQLIVNNPEKCAIVLDS